MVPGPRRLLICTLVLLSGADAARAQFDEFRNSPTITTEQKARIGTWLTEKLAVVEKARTPEALRTFLTEVDTERENPRNSLEFVKAMGEQAAALAKVRFAKPDLDGTTGGALAVALAEMAPAEALDAFLIGMESPLQAVRYKSAAEVAGRLAQYTTDAKKRGEVAAIVRRAALKEENGYILQHMYKAISFTPLDAETFSTFLAVFDARLQRRRAGAQAVDPGEIPVFEHLALPAVHGPLNQQQKVELVQRLAVFLRMHAQRSGAGNVGPDEFNFIGYSLTGNEAALTAITGTTSGGNIQGVFGHGTAAVTQEAVRWVGDAATGAKGVLNEAPWNVPVGAP